MKDSEATPISYPSFTSWIPESELQDRIAVEQIKFWRKTRILDEDADSGFEIVEILWNGAFGMFSLSVWEFHVGA